MKDYLKTYQMVLKTVSPVHIGTGKTLSKKEYIFLNNKKKVLIPDVNKLYQGLQRKGMGTQFTQYLLTDERIDLNTWLQKNNISPKDYGRWIRYELDCGDFLQEEGKKAIEVMEFQKDSYGLPYVPGTSVKGMLRTILLSYRLMTEKEAWSNERKQVSREAKQSGNKGKRYLSRENALIEEKLLHTLSRKDEKGKEVDSRNAVNDCLSGLIVGDSEPLSLEDLVLCQKIDENVEGKQHAINILRESIKPGRDIKFKLTIDTEICKYSIEDILKAAELFGEAYYEMYLSKFKCSDRPAGNSVWLGGGAGFFTKTVMYPLLGQKQGLEAAASVFEHTLPYKIAGQHKHYRDKDLGVSPHILKCTRYEGRRFVMGLCHLKVEDSGCG